MVSRSEHVGAATSERRHRTNEAVLAIIASVAALSFSDAVIKATGLSLPLWQLFVLRSALAVPVLWWLARKRGVMALSLSKWVLLRSALLVLMWFSYYSALPFTALSSAAAAYYTGPLFIVALLALVARQMPKSRALLAIGIGFSGVLLIVRPDPSGFAWAAFLPVIAAFFYGCAMVITSVKCREHDPFTLALALNVAFIISGLFLGLFSGKEGSFTLGPWQSVSAPLVATISALAALMIIGSVCAAIAYQRGPAATVAAFDYSYLVFSLLWGFLVFSEVPSIVGLAGIVLVVAGGVLALPWGGNREAINEP